jgi:hypothetical protein
MTPEQKEKAIEDAYRLLVRLEISSWSEPPDDPKEELERTIALVECVFGEPAIYRSIPEPVRKRAIEFLKQCRPPIGKHGGYSTAERDRVIIEAIVFIHRKYGINPTRNLINQGKACGCSIVMEALRELEINLSEKTIANIWDARPVPE